MDAYNNSEPGFYEEGDDIPELIVGEFRDAEPYYYQGKLHTAVVKHHSYVDFRSVFASPNSR